MIVTILGSFWPLFFLFSLKSIPQKRSPLTNCFFALTWTTPNISTDSKNFELVRLNILGIFLLFLSQYANHGLWIEKTPSAIISLTIMYDLK